jgi:small subunit ribosomal protein S9
VIEEPETPEEQPAEEEPTAPEAEAPAEEQPAAAETETETETEAPAAAEAEAEPPVAEQPATEAEAPAEAEAEEDEGPAPRVKPEIPGADLEVDIVLDGDTVAPTGEGEEGEDIEGAASEEPEVEQPLPIADASIDLGKDARYHGTGRRKTAVARVTLRPGSGAYAINGRDLDTFFPRATLQRNIRQPLETVGYEARMDVVAAIHGGGVASQAGALRHGISRALLEADPNLRAELKRRGFLTRDARVKERKKAGLKKARKRPQFSKR